MSRAYYGAYSMLASELLEAGYSSFGRHKNPDHSSLPMLVNNNLSGMSIANRRLVASATRRLRARREEADYKPQVEVGTDASREANVDLELICRTLGG